MAILLMNKYIETKGMYRPISLKFLILNREFTEDIFLIGMMSLSISMMVNRILIKILNHLLSFLIIRNQNLKNSTNTHVIVLLIVVLNF